MAPCRSLVGGCDLTGCMVSKLMESLNIGCRVPSNGLTYANLKTLHILHAACDPASSLIKAVVTGFQVTW